jgi:hypothetical protein
MRSEIRIRFECGIMFEMRFGTRFGTRFVTRFLTRFGKSYAVSQGGLRRIIIFLISSQIGAWVFASRTFWKMPFNIS